MDAIKGFGSGIMEQLVPSKCFASKAAHVLIQSTAANKAFEPLLRANEKEILSFKRKTFKYGTTDRHQVSLSFRHYLMLL